MASCDDRCVHTSTKGKAIINLIDISLVVHFGPILGSRKYTETAAVGVSLPSKLVYSSYIGAKEEATLIS